MIKWEFTPQTQNVVTKAAAAQKMADHGRPQNLRSVILMQASQRFTLFDSSSPINDDGYVMGDCRIDGMVCRLIDRINLERNVLQLVELFGVRFKRCHMFVSKTDGSIDKAQVHLMTALLCSMMCLLCGKQDPRVGLWPF
eukprot:c10517_g1_i4.p1 GENE.c10517_g1_i4~~c10517_g1_i4.p1  ORF type:complete len:140 (-),score=23.43 c10517_g1_i4:793-1212(-)